MQVQRLQRFATYGYLKQIVLKMIAADLADGLGGGLSDAESEAEDMVCSLRYTYYAVLCCALECCAALCCAV